MESKELTVLVESSSEEMLSILTSMKGLLILTEHYANPQETNSYLAMLSTCITKLETAIQLTRHKARDNEGRISA